MTRSRTSRWFGLALAVGLAATAGCTPDRRDSDPPRDAVPAGQFRLVAFDSCQQVAESLRDATRRHVGPWGLRGGEFDGSAMAEAVPDLGQAVAPGGPVAAGDATAPGGPRYSGTNVHEAGVDEPDLVKTDGRRIVIVHRGLLRIVDARRKVQTGVLDLVPEEDGWVPADLLLSGDRALVLLRGGVYPMVDGPAVDLIPSSALPRPRLLLVDLAGGPRLLGEYTIDGSVVDARATGPVARVVIRSSPRLEFPTFSSDVAESTRLDANRKVVDEADLADWLPRYRVTTDDGTTEGSVDCTAVHRPERFTGTSMLTVLTFDLTAPTFDGGDPVTVVTDGETVYSDGSSLYVATDRWAGRTVAEDRPAGADGLPAEVDDRTEIHKFDVSRPGPPRYVASGVVDGWLINQYAMSEWDGHLRVATTSGGRRTREPEESESTVTVLAQRGRELVAVGVVGGLGAGERIYSVRFVGPVGHVVTFRETDPLYTVDLSDPAAPAPRGELKITGYSAYLHPLDDGRLLGVGQEADERGRTQGTQVSLFDVTDLGDPTRLARHHVADSYSQAEIDPHAFLWWPAERLLVVPLVTHGTDRPPDNGALLLRVDERSLTEVGTVTHPDGDRWAGGPRIRRSLVIDDTLWTLSDRGLQANRLSTLEHVAWFAFD